MTPDTKRLLEEALRLPPEGRAALAGTLLDSLDSETDPGLEEAWALELARRSKEIDSGVVKCVPWSEARRAILNP
jgi:putative addiction module component (TIGR02574 family)